MNTSYASVLPNRTSGLLRSVLPLSVIAAAGLIGCSSEGSVDGGEATTLIDEAGGEAHSDDGRLLLTFPEGAVSSEAEVTISRPPTPDRDDLYSHLYAIDVGGEILEPVELMLGPVEEHGGEDLVLGRLGDAGEVEVIAGSARAGDFVTGQLSSFSDSHYGAFAADGGNGNGNGNGNGDGGQGTGSIATAEVSAGINYTCAVPVAGGDAYCWGEVELADSQTPPAGVEFATLDTGTFHTCGIRANDASIECWGGYDRGGVVNWSEAPEGEFVAVTSAAVHTCGLRTDGSVGCLWDPHNEPDDGVPLVQADPPDDTFSAIAAADGDTCGIRDEDSTLSCWGSDLQGQSSPPAGQFSALGSGTRSFCAVRADDGALECWGSDGTGQTSPPSGAFTAVDGGNGHICGIRGDDTVACWGQNGAGESDPPAGAFTAITAHGATTDDGEGAAHSCGVRADDGLVECWGTDSGRITPP